VKGKVLKINPFGLFVELDKEIHGLAHISELSNKPISDPLEVAKIGDEIEFIIISIEPENHRLGLSLKALKSPRDEKNLNSETELKEAAEKETGNLDNTLVQVEEKSDKK
jgi:small subunit ribosomal protein S1